MYAERDCRPEKEPQKQEEEFKRHLMFVLQHMRKNLKKMEQGSVCVKEAEDSEAERM